MFLLANLLEALAAILNLFLTLYMWLIIARAVISWVSPDPHNTIVRILYLCTEPVLYRVRRAFPFNMGGIDFSPIIIFVVIIFLQRFLVQSLYDMAQAMR
jgi:YggT family protein